MNEDIIKNEKYGDFSVIESTRSGYKCQCSCGNIRVYKKCELLSGKLTKCSNCIVTEKRKLLINKTYNKWTIKKHIKGNIYECVCQCGNISNITGTAIKKGYTKGCHECHIKAKAKTNLNTELTDSIWNKIIYHSKVRKIDFIISKEYAKKILLIQNFKCNLSGLDLYFALNNKSHMSGGTTASLDRIDSSKGYIEGNVQWVHKDINKMKLDCNEEYFKKLCKKISEHIKIDFSHIKDTDTVIIPIFNEKLSIDKVIEIKKALLENKSIKSIAKKFNITTANVYNIRSGKSWKDI